MTIKPILECFSIAKKDEKKWKKHKGLLFVGKDDRKSEEYTKSKN